MTYRVAQGTYNLDLADVTPQPKSVSAVQPGRILRGTDLSAFADGFGSAQLTWTVLEADEYGPLLAQFGLDDARTAAVTVQMPDELRILRSYTGMAERLPARFELGLWREVSIQLNGLTPFTLSFELLTNGFFSVWTGDDPDGWTVVESTPFSEVTANSGLNLISDGSEVASIAQAVLTSGTLYSVAVTVASISGTLEISIGTETRTVTTAGVVRFAAIASATDFIIRTDGACDAILTQASVVAVTPQEIV